MIRISSFLILFFVMFSPFVEAKNLYVNNSGSPACSDSTTYANNSASNPWCTLLRAVRGNSDGNRDTAAVPAQAAQAGDTVKVTAGTYNYAGTWASRDWLRVIYDPINSGTSWTPGEFITFEAVGTVNLTVTQKSAAVIGSNTGQYVKWVGFTVNENNIVFNNALTAITVSNIWLEGNTIIGKYTAVNDNHTGIMVHGPRDKACTGVISGTIIRNNSISLVTGNSGRNDTAITLYCADNILIEHNEIFSNANGIYSKSSYTDSALDPAVTIRYNIFRDHASFGSAIESQSWSYWHVYQNLFLRNGYGFTMFNFEYFVGANKPKNYKIVNNTFYQNGYAFRLEGRCDIATNMVYRNNIVRSSATNSVWGESSTCSTVAGGMTKRNYDFDYNIYSQGSNFGKLYGTNFSLATWQGATYDNQDTHSAQNVDPLFANAAGNDFRLCTGVGTPRANCTGASPCLSGGANAGVDILDLDNDGQTNDAITIGAYITGNEVMGITAILPTKRSTTVAPSKGQVK